MQTLFDNKGKQLADFSGGEIEIVPPLTTN
jgi:hypothetical protein